MRGEYGVPFMNDMSSLQIFCRQIRNRSIDNKRAIELLFSRNIFGPIIAILRQELDSLVRCIYLLSIDNIDYRNELVEYSISGKKWRSLDGKKVIRDREMVNLAQRLHGWTQSVYTFGCAFIHLSNFHDYENRNPFDSLEEAEFEAVRYYLSYYHGTLIDRNSSLAHITWTLPSVFDKISGNLEFYVKELEEGKVIAIDEL